MRVASLLIGVLVGLAGAQSLAAQASTRLDTLSGRAGNVYGSGIGLNIALTNSGFGLGGYYARALGASTSLIAEFMIVSVKDEKEQRFFGYFGESIIPNKENYFHTIPVLVGVQKRLFRENIHDNFRPYVQVSVGPTFGWQSPYYRDDNGNGFRDGNERSFDILTAFSKGQARFGIGGSVSLGANFGLSRKITQGLRFGYTFAWFTEGVQLLEPRVKSADHFFGTPTVTITFGKIR
jgi:hypothetical protein